MMKVIILAGGYGTRLAEFTETIPKPMVTIGERPILWSMCCDMLIMGIKIYIALGYKAEVIKSIS